MLYQTELLPDAGCLKAFRAVAQAPLLEPRRLPARPLFRGSIVGGGKRTYVSTLQVRERPVRKTVYVTGGVGLIVLGVLLAPLPGPGGLPVAMIGTVVLLRHSPRMRRHWVRARKRWPRLMAPLDGVLRRIRRKRPNPTES